MTEKSYPGLRRASLEIALDNGGIHRGRSVEAQEAEFERWLLRHPSDVLDPVDAWLASLSEDDIRVVCTAGEGEPEQTALLEVAPPFTDYLLTDYFDEVC